MKPWYFFILLYFCVTTKAAEKIEFATHYDYPPFIVDIRKQEGFVFDLAKYLSEKSKGRYEFQVTFVPRVRIESYLAKNQKIVVPFVSPKWFGDIEKKRYLWTDILLKDRNVVVTRVQSKFEYKGLDSLMGKTMGYPLGNKIVILDPLIAAGKIKSEESPSVLGNFKKLMEGRIDFLVTGEMIARDLIEREHWQMNLHISKVPIDVFERRILISPVTELGLQQWLNNEIKALVRSKQQPAFMKHYGSKSIDTPLKTP